MCASGSACSLNRHWRRFGRARSIGPALTQNLSVQTRGSGETPMASKEGCDLVLVFARMLFTNGQATDQTVDAAERLGRALGLHVKVTARWGELQLQSTSEHLTLFSH